MNLNLSKAEFLAMSPKEFHALTKCYQDREERMDRRIATLQAFYVNCNSEMELTSDDFMTTKRVAKKANSVLENQLTVLFGCGPGVEKRKGEETNV